MLKLIRQTLILSFVAVMAIAQPLSIVSAQILNSQAAISYNTSKKLCVDLITDLELGSTDEVGGTGTVRKLQEFLYPQYLSVAATGYFGELTKAAVTKFQTANNITPAVGYVGPLTRAKIKAISCEGVKSASAVDSGTVPFNGTAVPNNTVSSYNNNNLGWWLAPAPTPSATDSRPVGSIGSVNPPTTPPPTTTPPPAPVTNCEQYTGVIPGETRRLTVNQKSFANYTMPGVNQAGLNRLSQDLAGPMRTNPRAQVDRISFQAGEAQAYRFTTSDYNMPFHKMFTTGENPQQNEDGGILYVSVSKCPGDFTSPELTNGRAVFSNGFVQVGGCFSEGLGQPRLDFGYRQTGCQLEPNQTYYLNISSGFKWQVLDVVIYQSDIGFFGYKTSTGGASQAPIMVMKGMEDTYREIHSVMSAWNTSAYNAMQDLRNRIAACVNSGQPRTSCNFTPNIPAFPGQWR